MQWLTSFSERFPSCKFLLAYVFLIASTSSVHALQQPGAVDPNDEDPERRRILQLILELEKGTSDRLSQSVESFDLAWEMAVRREDPLLNSNTSETQLLQPGQHEINAGARARIQRIYNSSSADFKNALEEFASAGAETALKEALEIGSTRELTQVILRHQFTRAGQKALENIVQLRRSRGEALAAALQYARLLELRNDASAESRVRLALMWWNAGLAEEATDLLRALAVTDSGKTIQFNESDLTVPSIEDDLVGWLVMHADKRPSDTPLWSQPMGSYRRTQLLPTGPAELAELWRVSSFECAECVDCLSDDEINRLLRPMASRMERIFRRSLVLNQTSMPVAQPLVVGDQLIYRSAAKIRAVDLETGELNWESTLIDRRLNSSLESWRRRGIDNEAVLIASQNQLLSDRNALPSHLIRANIGGQLTSNGQLVFAVEESTSETMNVAAGGQPGTSQTPVNYLRAYDVTTGWLKGQAGGSMGASGRSGRVNPLAGMYFLGAPLILGDHVYVMAESDQGIFLLQINVVPLFDEEGQVDLRPVRSQLLSIPRRSLREHPVRKLAGLIPSFGNGLLVCNSCDEQVMAVSAADHSIRWVYRYPGNVSTSELTRQSVLGNAFNTDLSDQRDKSTRWVDALPRIHAGRVFLTPRDSDRLICLDLNTGEELWTKPRGSMRQLAAVQDDRLVLTGQRHVESRSSSTGDLLWRFEFDRERVCGRATCNGKVVQVPTSGPSIVTLDIQTGRSLLQQKVQGDLPGNLLTVQGKLISQNISGVSAYATPQSQAGSLIVEAKQSLLDGKIVDAEKSIAAIRANQNSDADVSEAETLLVDLLLESLRLNFKETAPRIPELQQMMEASVVSDDEVSALAMTMIGMTLGDSAILPEQWQMINQQKQRLTQLQVLLAQQFQSKDGASAEDVAAQMLRLLEESSTELESNSGDVLIRSRRIALASVFRSMQQLDANVVSRVKSALGDEISAKIKAAATEKESLEWWQALLFLDINAPLPRLLSDPAIVLPKRFDEAVREMSLLQAASSKVNGELLLKRWSENSPESLVDVVVRAQATALHRKQNPLKAVEPIQSLARDFVLSGELKARPDLISTAVKNVTFSPWVGKPNAKESAARIGQSPAPLRMNSPYQNIPIFGKPGAFGNWSLLQRPSSNTVFAYDQQGRLRWTFEPDRPTNLSYRSRQIPPSYATAYGHLLAMKISSKIYMLDCSVASKNQAPNLLWDLDFAAEVGGVSRAQSSTKAFQTTTQYDVQKPGFFPLAEISPHGVAVYSGQRLALLNTLTGTREWAVDSLPDDCSITSTNDEVMLLSSGAGTVECRSLLDGSVNSVESLPAWWVDANENSNASIYQLELNPGDQERWRLTVGEGRCLVLRRNTEASALDLYDFKTAKNVWSIELPQDSVVSNVVDGHIGVLSDGNTFQVLDVNAGARVCKHKVPDATQSQFLYLRRSGGQWVAITSAYSEDYYDQNPVSYSVLANGHVYSVNCNSGELSWTKPIEYDWLKVLTPTMAPMPPNIPLLVLVKRPGKPFDANGQRRRGGIQYEATIFDVRSGEVIYKGENLGRDLSYHCMNIDPENRVIKIGFGERDVVIKYGDAKDVDE